MALEQNNTAFEFETMLRRHLSQGAMTEPCAGFDADMTNAYLENALGTATRTRYESHLAGCSSCRHHLIQLSQLIQQPQTEPQFAPFVKPVSIWSHWKSVVAEWIEAFNASMGKQGWATAGAAAVVLMTVVSVQLWRQQQSAAPTEQPGQTSLAAVGNSNGAAPTSSPSLETGGNSGLANFIDNQNSQRLALNQVPTPQVSPMPVDPSVTATQPLAPGGKSGSELIATVPPSPPQTATSNLFPSFSDKTTFTAPAQPVSVEMVAPPPPVFEIEKSDSVVAAHINPSPSDNPMKKAKSDTSKPVRSAFDKALSFMPTRKADGGRKLEEKEIEPDAPKVLSIRRRDKVFNYQGGFWIDSAYKPEMAWRVTKLAYDSEEYKQLLASEPLLKDYFAHGPAIVVWKDKIYKAVSK